MNRTDRLYALVEELRAAAPGHRTATALAGRFEVSVRTIERDIAALQQSGVPIYATPGRRGGYAIDRVTSLPPVNFTPEEATAVAIALERHVGGPFAAAARVALLKILGAMSGSAAEAAGRLAERIRIIERPAPARMSVPSVLEQGIVHRRVVRLTYEDPSGHVTRRDVEPAAFVGSDEHWYLVGWCRLRDAARVFRVDRVRSAALTGDLAPERSFEEVMRPDGSPATHGVPLP